MLREDISKLRQNYDYSKLLESEAESDAIKQFDKWFDEAREAGVIEPNIMTLATCNNNVPDARIVLLKSFDDKGFVFFTNYNSAKGQELKDNPQAALVFFWMNLQRQVRIRGAIQRIDAVHSEAYFRSRPVDSQYGAIASNQSEPISSRDALENRYAEVLEEYKDKEAKMPEHWGGYLLAPTEIEFWQGRVGRLHDRLLYKHEKDAWSRVRLQP